MRPKILKYETLEATLAAFYSAAERVGATVDASDSALSFTVNGFLYRVGDDAPTHIEVFNLAATREGYGEQICD